MDNHEAVHDSAITPPPDAEERTVEQEPEDLTLGQWLGRNGPLLAVIAALLAFLYVKFSPEDLWTIGKVAIGLSLVIFIHELGHFLVAKWCDVHVTVFSIGFGPPLPGCSFKWGETTYKLALFPLGGYVQMVGQVDGDESSDGNDDDPRSYRNKSVWQRMAIISAGVVMNVILAVVCFVIVFKGPGKDRRAPVIDAVESGSPSFVQGLRTGAEILEIDDTRKPYFETLLKSVVGSAYGETIRFVCKRPGDKEPTVEDIEPKKNPITGRPMIGVGPASCLDLIDTRSVRGSDFKHPAMFDSPAARANPPFEFGDRIIACSDPTDPKKVTDLPLDPRKPNSQQRDYFEFSRRMKLLAGKEVIVRVERTVEKKKTAKVDIHVPPAFHRTFGARMQMGEITSIREGSPAARAGVKARDASKGRGGDIIQRVEVKEPGGKLMVFGDKLPLDPERLGFELLQWAVRVFKAKTKPTPADLNVKLHVRREREAPGAQFRDLALDLTWDNSWRFDKIYPMSRFAPLAIAELGLAYQVKTTVSSVETGFTDKVQPGDVIKAVQFHVPTKDDSLKVRDWYEIGDDDFAESFWILQDARKVGLKIQRGKETVEVLVDAKEDTTWPLDERGFIFSPDLRRQKASGYVEAVAFGLQDTYDLGVQVFQSLRGIATGRISPKNLHGPLGIAQFAFHMAGYDFWEFIFFLGMISVNLAVVNFLPIPVLDGGHMVFLIYEKLRGKPAPEGVRIGATWAGLALILCLMVFVIGVDLTRIFKGS